MPRILWAAGAAPDQMFIQAALAQATTKPSAEFVDDSEALLQRVAQERPDLVVLDLQMPEGGALEVLSLLQRRGESPPVVVFGRAPGRPTIEACQRLGAATVVAKPEGFREYREAVIGIGQHPALVSR